MRARRFDVVDRRCGVGGDYVYEELSGPPVYREPCRGLPTHRYRSPGMVEGHWSYRCERHVKWLASTGLVIESLASGGEGQR